MFIHKRAVILIALMLAGCNLPGRESDLTITASPPGESVTGDTPEDQSTTTQEEPLPSAEATESPSLPGVIVQDVAGGRLLHVNAQSGQVDVWVEEAPLLVNPEFIQQMALDSGTFFAVGGPDNPVVFRVSEGQIDEVSFTRPPDEQAQLMGVAVWPGTGSQGALLAWSVVTFTEDEVISTLKIGPVRGSGEIREVAQYTSEENGFLKPVRWSVDGQRLYYTEEEGGFGSVGANYFGFTTLRYFDRTTGSTATAVPDDIFPLITCLDDISRDEQLVAHHCGGAVGVLDLSKNLLNTLIFSPDVGEDTRVIGAARFSPDDSRLAFAMTRGDLTGEQSWIAVTDDLNGRSRVLVTGEEGYFFSRIDWLDSQTLVVTALNGEVQSDRPAQVWVVPLEGEAWQAAEGEVLAVLNPDASDSAVPPPPDVGGRSGGEGESDATPSDEPTPIPTQPVPDQPDPPDVGDIIYESQFLSGWPDIEQSGSQAVLRGDGYLVSVSRSYLFAFTEQVERAALYVEVTATPQECPAGGSYGVVFHIESTSRFRYGTVSCGGRFGLYERRDSDQVLQLAEGTLPDAVTPSTGAHRIGVLAQDDTLTLIVDDYRVAVVGVSRLPVGNVGPYVETTGSPIAMLYTRLVAHEP